MFAWRRTWPKNSWLPTRASHQPVPPPFADTAKGRGLERCQTELSQTALAGGGLGAGADQADWERRCAWLVVRIFPACWRIQVFDRKGEQQRRQGIHCWPWVDSEAKQFCKNRGGQISWRLTISKPSLLFRMIETWCAACQVVLTDGLWKWTAAALFAHTMPRRTEALRHALHRLLCRLHRL